MKILDSGTVDLSCQPGLGYGPPTTALLLQLQHGRSQPVTKSMQRSHFCAVSSASRSGHFEALGGIKAAVGTRAVMGSEPRVCGFRAGSPDA